MKYYQIFVNCLRQSHNIFLEYELNNTIKNWLKGCKEILMTDTSVLS